MDGQLLEEFVKEIYLLKGYLCLQNLPGKPKGSGGRDEFDLVAIKFNKSKVSEVVWVEVTAYLSKGANAVFDKFTDKKEEYLRSYLNEMYNIDWKGKISKRFIVQTHHTSIKARDDLPAETKIIFISELIEDIKTIKQEFREKYKKIAGSISPSSDLTLPNAFSIIELLDNNK